jgi:hypothetical protein
MRRTDQTFDLVSYNERNINKFGLHGGCYG